MNFRLRKIPKARFEQIRDFLAYDAESGQFTWIKKASFKVTIGSRAGCQAPNGYRFIRFGGVHYKEHALAWWWVHGSFPVAKMMIDHINGHPEDNRITNLRVVTCSQNHMNKAHKKNGTSRFKGVTRMADGRWQAHIRYRGKNYNLGHYVNDEDAAKAYDARAARMFGAYARLNFPEVPHE